MKIAAYRAGLTQERSHLRRTWLPGAQKGGSSKSASSLSQRRAAGS